MFIACNLLQISPLKLCFKKLRFFLNVFSECRTHTFGDRMLSWGRGGEEKWALRQFCPTTEESLKDALLRCDTFEVEDRER
jgi:hypothetical protein